MIEQQPILTDPHTIDWRDKDTYDVKCYQCGKDGKLSHCDYCYRVYHHAKCQGLEADQNLKWICKCCKRQKICEFCDKLVQNQIKQQNTAICTICLTAVHLTCYYSPLSLKQHHFKGLPLSTKTYVCKKCLLKYGVKSIKQTKRQLCHQLLTFLQKLIILVQIKTRSPVHYGWFLQQDVREAIRIKKYKVQVQSSQENVSNLHIQRIIKMKYPRCYEDISFQVISQMVLDDQRVVKYGGMDNFYFLVKWSHRDYNCVTWQDQTIIKALQPQNSALRLYLNRKQLLLNPDFDQFAVFQNSFREQYFSQIQAGPANNSFHMSRYRSIYPVQLITYNDLKQTIQEMCNYFNQIIILQRQKEPIIIVTTNDHYIIWKKQLERYCQHINWVGFNGSQKNVNFVKSHFFNQTQTYQSTASNRQKPTFKNQFQILLIPYDKYIKNKQFILNHLTAISVFVFSNFRKHSFLNYYNVRSDQSRIYPHHCIFVMRSNREDIAGQIQLCESVGGYFAGETMLKHDNQWGKSQLIQGKVINFKTKPLWKKQIKKPEQSKLERKIIWNELRRSVFLRYVLQHGFTNDIDQFYIKLQQFSKTIFDWDLSRSRQPFKTYLVSFINIISTYGELSQSSDMIKYYCFDIAPQLIVKRIGHIQQLRIQSTSDPLYG